MSGSRAERAGMEKGEEKEEKEDEPRRSSCFLAREEPSSVRRMMSERSVPE
jgi:hypothetical protein